jgi:hypothetical protein
MIHFKNISHIRFVIGWLHITLTFIYYVKIYLLLIKTLFIFNNHLCLINESRVNINSLGQKCFVMEIMK